LCLSGASKRWSRSHLMNLKVHQKSHCQQLKYRWEYSFEIHYLNWKLHVKIFWQDEKVIEESLKIWYGVSSSAKIAFSLTNAICCSLVSFKLPLVLKMTNIWWPHACHFLHLFWSTKCFFHILSWILRGQQKAFHVWASSLKQKIKQWMLSETVSRELCQTPIQLSNQLLALRDK